MHRRTEEPRAAERRERPHAMRDRVASQGHFRVAFTGEQPASGITGTIERSARDIGRCDEDQGSLRTAGTDLDTPTTTRRVGDAELGDLGAEQREHGVRVVAGVLVDREDLEGQPEPTKVLGGAANRDTDRLLVIAKGHDDGDIEPGSISHWSANEAPTVPQ